MDKDIEVCDEEEMIQKEIKKQKKKLKIRSEEVEGERKRKSI